MKVNDAVIRFLEKLQVNGIEDGRFVKSFLQENSRSLERDDVDEIHEWLLKTAESGAPRAQHSLAVCYLRGVFGYMDTDEAYRWCMQASKQDYAPAMTMLAGLRSEDQSFADADLSESIRLLRRAVDLKYGPAACHLGLGYLDGGLGHLPKNSDLARSYLAKGAEWGDASSMFHLASILLKGGDIADQRWALELLERAADHDQLEAILSLASIYREGRYGCKQDFEKASLYDGKYELVSRPLFYVIDPLSFLRPRPHK